MACTGLGVAQGQAPAPPTIIIAPPVSGPGCLIQTDFSANGRSNFELVVLEGSNLVHYWRANDTWNTPWRKGDVISSRAIAAGSIVQSDYMSGGHGNLEVVVPEEGGELVHYWRDSGRPNSPWIRAGLVTTGVTGAACLITSDYTTNGHRNFEVLVQKGNQLWHHWHAAGWGPDNWPGALATSGVTAISPSCLIQSDYKANAHRNFEVVVQKGKELWHHWRWDGMPRAPWPGIVAVSDVTGPGSLIMSDFKSGEIRNFEAMVQKGNNLWHYWRWDGMFSARWPGALAVTDIKGPGCIIQSNFVPSGHGTFELVVPARVQGVASGLTNELVHFFKWNQPAGQKWQRAQTITFHGRSEKVCQLTGDADWESGVPTTTLTQQRFGLGAVDLGYPVEHQGRLALLFGDTWATHTPHDGDEANPPDDAVGWITSRTPPTKSWNPDLEINVFPTPPPKFAPATVTGPIPVKQGYFNVPSGGVSNGGWLYAFFWTNHCMDARSCPETEDRNSIGRNVLARSSDNGRTFGDAVPMPTGFVYATGVNAEAITDLPAEQRLGTYVFAVPRYRGSIPYLAYAPPGTLGDPSSWLFFLGRKPNGRPSWTSSEVWTRGSRDPVTGQWVAPGHPELFPAIGQGDRCVGEFSVTWNSALRVWLLLYNCGSDIVARIARAPWGPWSEAKVILSRDQDGCPCRLRMAEGGCGNQESYWHYAETVPGEFYAPFVMERYTTWVLTPLQGRRATIYWLLSTWNPYQVTVMKTVLHVVGDLQTERDIRNRSF